MCSCRKEQSGGAFVDAMWRQREVRATIVMILIATLFCEGGIISQFGK